MILTLFAIPLVGACIVLASPTGDRAVQKFWALTSAFILSASAFAFVKDLPTKIHTFRYEGALEWLPKLGLSASWGMDGLTVMMACVAAVLLWVVVLHTMGQQSSSALRRLLGLHLLASGVVLLSIVTTNLVLALLCIELLGFVGLMLQARAESFRKGQISVFALGLASSVLVWGALGILGNSMMAQLGALDFSAATLVQLDSSKSGHLIVLFAFWLGMALKLPILPFHVLWSQDGDTKESVSAVLLPWLVLGVGATLLRYGLVVAPFFVGVFSQKILFVCMLAAAWSAGAALVSRDQRRSGMAWCSTLLLAMFVGVFTGTIEGYTAAIVLLATVVLLSPFVFAVPTLARDEAYAPTLFSVGTSFVPFTLAGLGIAFLTSGVFERVMTWVTYGGSFNLVLWLVLLLLALVAAQKPVFEASLKPAASPFARLIVLVLLVALVPNASLVLDRSRNFAEKQIQVLVEHSGESALGWMTDQKMQLPAKIERKKNQFKNLLFQ